MMRMTNRSFPHPIVGNADDVPGAEFQSTFDFASDRSNFYLTATIRCSSRTLLKLIERDIACYCLHVECSNTLFRQSFDFSGQSHRITIPATLIHDALEVNAFVRARKVISKYVVEGAHEDYAGAVFAVNPGDILAVSDGQKFDAEHDLDPLRRIGALMDISWSLKNDDHPMYALMDDDKIHIQLCKADFDSYAEMKNVPHLTNHLTTTLVLPVLMEAIAALDGEDPPATEWANRLQARLESLGLSSNKSSLEVAQLLLSLPIRRALASAQAFLTTSVS